MPAWQSVLVLQTSLTALPSLTPHPQAPLKSPCLLNFWMRAFPLDARYTQPPRRSTALPIGFWNRPAEEPVLPFEASLIRKDLSVWNVSSSPVVVPAAFVATTRK